MDNDNFYQYPNVAPAEPGDSDHLPETAIAGLAILAERLERLLRFCAELQSENQVLRERSEAMQTERDALRDRNEQLRARIEAMIVRLKDLEQAS